MSQFTRIPAVSLQEHFTIKWLTSLNSKELANKVADQRWQEVVKQLVKSQQPADKLVRLIKKAIDQSIKSEPVLQNFLTWVFKKSGSIQANYKPVAIRAFYFALEYFYTRDLAQDFASDPIFVLDIALQFDIADDILSKLNLGLSNNFYFNHNLNLIAEYNSTIFDDLTITLHLISTLINYHSRGRTHTHDLEGLNYEQAYNLGFYENFQEDLFNELEQELNLDLIDGLDNNLALDCKNLFNRTAMNAFNHTQAEKLDQLEQALSTPRIADLEFPQWWQTYGNQWVKELRQLIIKHCDIGHDWQFSYAQKKQLQHYYDVNKFLVDLINIQGAVSDTTCIEIENTLLLPWEELQRRF